MSTFGCVILAFAVGMIAGIVTSMIAWIVPLRCEREQWRNAALDSERQLEWEHTEMVRVGDPVKWSK